MEKVAKWITRGVLMFLLMPPAAAQNGLSETASACELCLRPLAVVAENGPAEATADTGWWGGTDQEAVQEIWDSPRSSETDVSYDLGYYKYVIIDFLYPVIMVALIFLTATRKRLVGRCWLLVFFCGLLVVTLSNLIGLLLISRGVIPADHYLLNRISPFINHLLPLFSYCCLIPFILQTSKSQCQIMPGISNQNHEGMHSSDADFCKKQGAAQHPLPPATSPDIRFYIKPGTAGLWITLVILGGLFFLPIELDRELAKSIGMGLIVSMALSIVILVRYHKLKKEPYLVLTRRGIDCLPLFGKAWSVPSDQIESVALSDKSLTVQRGPGGKKYSVAVRPLVPEDRAALAAWVGEWKNKGMEKHDRT
jgi:hypothetical protein